MSKEDEKNKIIKEPQDEALDSYKLIAYIVPIGAVSEGSKVFIDGSQSYYKLSNNTAPYSELPTITSTRSISENDGVIYIWEQISGPKVDLVDNYTSMPSFAAPYIEFDYTDANPMPCTILQFQLIVKDKNGMKSEPASVQVIVKMVQRALVLQGGGALGAYEVGVFKALCESLIEKIKDSSRSNLQNNDNRLLFDIVAGTSIGAVNAAIIVGNVLQYYNNNNNNRDNNKEKRFTSVNQAEVWTNTVKKLEEFWDDVSNPLSTIPKWMQDNSLFESWFNSWKFTNELNDSLFASWWDYAKNLRIRWDQFYDLMSRPTTFGTKGKEENFEESRYAS
jgi:hypothetical protein